MGRAATRSQLTSCGPARRDGRVVFELATPRHDAALRQLLRENPMGGSITVSLEREPSFFAASALEGPEHQTIVALEEGSVVAAGSVSARRRFINGRPMRMGYLGGLRLDTSCRGRSSVLRRGYEALRRLHEQDGPSIYLTSIIADNLRARRFLEKSLPGMPTYRYLGEFVTLLFRYDRPRLRRSQLQKEQKQYGLITAACEHRSQILELLHQHNRAYQFSPEWSADEIHPENFRLAYSRDGTPLACAAIWDQRAIKQTVVRGYSGYLRWARPIINFGAAFLKRPGLPQIGTRISHAFISHLAVRPDHPQLLTLLIDSLQDTAQSLTIDYLTLGFDARDPRLTHLRRSFHPREYASRIYVVHWEDAAALAESLDDRLMAPEVAIL